MPKHSRLKISSIESKKPYKKNLFLDEKQQLAETVHTYPCLNDKNKKEYKDNTLCQNAWGTVIEKMEFIKNGTYFLIFLILLLRGWS